MCVGKEYNYKIKLHTLCALKTNIFLRTNKLQI